MKITFWSGFKPKLSDYVQSTKKTTGNDKIQISKL